MLSQITSSAIKTPPKLWCSDDDVGWELVCYHGFTANQWALNSAVECRLHTSSRSNITRLTGTARYLKTRQGQVYKRELEREPINSSSKQRQLARAVLGPIIDEVLFFRSAHIPSEVLLRAHRLRFCERAGPLMQLSCRGVVSCAARTARLVQFPCASIRC